ncbi:MAG TPA: cytochrome c maturation protein CcmE [Actinomycetota bacterium]|jgi:cytochrome c-type biogenesis protein CcmE|nr:cytochrome c maturation protein CcmE [Actinomycetota bacterium]
MDERVSTPSRGGTKPKFLIGGAVIAVALLGLVGWAMGRTGSTAYFLKTSELAARGPTTGAAPVKVNGNVLPESVRRDGLVTEFTITDGKADIPVTTDQALPDAFWSAMAEGSDEVEVIATGSYDGRVFTAGEVLAKCPSKFKAKT